FAVGDTLGGTTASTAAAPRTAPPAPEPPAGPNRVARGTPRPGSVLTPPHRLNEVKPRYPDARRAAGIEADVLLVVSLDATGRVLSVTVGRSSGDDAFDESARAAARQERFSPALRDGVPVPTTFTFTTRFRLDTP
ncbi:MAG TPA: energy transducer TonB, partial [Polyangia bacterium]|nr:energy transducer TonB [Polyangia bacterium]